MKFFVLNSSGNVGKSLISRELLYPRLDKPLIIEVETVNRGSKEIAHLNVEQFKSGDDFMNLYLKIMEVENVIVDVGASNLANFWEQMSGYEGIELLFDMFIIPTVSGDKEMTDTYKTIKFLRAQGIDDSKIKVIFNRVKNSVDSEFSVLLSTDYDFNTSLAIKESEIFKELGLMKLTISDVYNPSLEYYKSFILSAKNPKEKLMLVKKDLANRMAVKMKKDLDYIFQTVTGLEPQQEKKIEISLEEEKELESEINDNDEEL